MAEKGPARCARGIGQRLLYRASAVLAVPPIFVLIFRGSDKPLPADVRRDGAPTGRCRSDCSSRSVIHACPPCDFHRRALSGDGLDALLLFSQTLLLCDRLFFARGLADSLGPGVGGFLAEGELMSRLHEVGVGSFRFYVLTHNDPSFVIAGSYDCCASLQITKGPLAPS